MAKLASIRFINLGVLLVLAGCGLKPPFDAFFGVVNASFIEEEPSVLPCATASGKLSVQDFVLNIENIMPESGRSEHYLMPENAPIETPITVEGWCYGEDGEELGYVRVTRAYTNTRIPIIDVIAPRKNPPPSTGTSCVPPTEARGLEFCISSQMFD